LKQYDITLITAVAYEIPVEVDWYIQQVLDEDGLVQSALEDLGFRVNRVAWSSDFDWTTTHFALFRTPWDYAQKFEAFSQWLQSTRTKVHFINSLPQIYWNSDKHYLKELNDSGICIPPTHYISKGTQTTLKQLHEELDWKHTVLKPTISAAGRHTYQLRPEDWASHEQIFQELIAEEDLMLQPFLSNITTKGEIALMLIGGEVTHAVLKTAKKGDFRVQDDFGGTVATYTPSTEAIELAQRVVKACPSLPLYARVDLVWDNDNQLAVSELEIFEPEMWFRFYPTAAKRLATTIDQYTKTVLS
jgi:glutathione synthase/RimK-type ligase-like ATP-grasp enzyme